MGNVGSAVLQDLPPRILDKVCTCSNTKDKWGWQHPERPIPQQTYWVHLVCGKPNKFICVWECDDCDRLFVPKEPLPYPEFKIEVLCDDCAGR